MKISIYDFQPSHVPWVETVDRSDGTLTLESYYFKDNMVLNEFAAEIWNLCDGINSVAQIIKQFRCKYPENSEPSEDIRNMLEVLEKQNLLEFFGRNSGQTLCL